MQLKIGKRRYEVATVQQAIALIFAYSKHDHEDLAEIMRNHGEGD